MPTHCGSDVISTNCREQAGSPSKYRDVLEYPSHELNLFINKQHRNRRRHNGDSMDARALSA